MRLILLLLTVVGLVGCSQESGTIKPEVQQMKAGARGKK
jgi:hypothetical protein